MTEAETLLDQFLEEECTRHVRGLILEAFAARERDPTVAERGFDFNRFEISLKFDRDIVVVEDILEEDESETIGLSAFARRLREHDPTG